MYNPLAKDQIGANAAAVGAGWVAHRNGRHPMDTFNIAMWWRYFYKNATLSLVLVPATVLYGYRTNNTWWWLPLMLALEVFVFGVCYVSLVNVSGFKQRLAYRIFRPLWRPFPNVARFWWYALLFFPLWLLMYINCYGWWMAHPGTH
jgi:hypothetical protein